MSRILAYIRDERIVARTRTNLVVVPRGNAQLQTWGVQAGTAETLSSATVSASDGPVVGPGGLSVGTYVQRVITNPKTTGSSGPWCRTPTGGFAGVAGDVLTASMYVRYSIETVVNVSVQARLGATIVSNTTIPEVVCPANVWTRIGGTVEATGPVDSTQVWAVLAGSVIQPTGTVIDTTAGLSEFADALLPYFDGSFPNAQWNGTANNSTSTQRQWVLGG